MPNRVIPVELTIAYVPLPDKFAEYRWSYTMCKLYGFDIGAGVEEDAGEDDEFDEWEAEDDDWEYRAAGVDPDRWEAVLGPGGGAAGDPAGTG